MTDIVNKKEKIVVSYFVNHPDAYISEISVQTGIPKSSVQRYLKKHGNVLLADGKTINAQLAENRKKGQYQGGVQSFKNNDFIKDEHGHFVGSVSTVTSIDKEAKKREDIKRICTYYLNNKSLTLDEVSSVFSELFGYTRDYVYDCLLDSRVSSVMGEEKSREIEESLNYNRTSFCRKLLEEGINLESLPSDFELTEEEKIVFMERFKNPNCSLEMVGKACNISRTTAAKLENSAISKLSKVVGKNK